MLVVLVLTVMVRRRSTAEDVVEPADPRHMDASLQEALWEEEPSAARAVASLERPEGWTKEQYAQWLTGPSPEGWAAEQWLAFVGEQLPLNDAS
jgi:hypothetical protein